MAYFSRVEYPQKTYFYKKKDGSIFACHAQEASLYHKKYEQVGVSDGKKYRDVLLSYNFKEKQRVSDKIAREALKKAFDAEFQVAQGNLEAPPDMRNRTARAGFSNAVRIDPSDFNL